MRAASTIVVVVPLSDVPLTNDLISVTASAANASASTAPVAMEVAVIPPAATLPTAPVTLPTAPLTLATTWSTSIFVALRFCAVVGLPILAQSTPASPPALTSSVRAAVVGMTAERFSIENDPISYPTTELPPTVPVVMTKLTFVAVANPLPLEATTRTLCNPVRASKSTVSVIPAVISVVPLPT